MVKFCIAFKVFHSNGLIIINSIFVTAESIRIIIVQPLTLQRPLIRPKVIVLDVIARESMAWSFQSFKLLLENYPEIADIKLPYILQEHRIVQ